MGCFRQPAGHRRDLVHGLRACQDGHRALFPLLAVLASVLGSDLAEHVQAGSGIKDSAPCSPGRGGILIASTAAAALPVFLLSATCCSVGVLMFRTGDRERPGSISLLPNQES